VVTCKIKHLQNICKNVLVFYFTCNHGLTVTFNRCLKNKHGLSALCSGAHVSTAISYRLLTLRALMILLLLLLSTHNQNVSDATSCRHLRSASSSALVVQATRCSTLGDRVFAVAGPRAWNSLPHFVTGCTVHIIKVLLGNILSYSPGHSPARNTSLGLCEL